MNGLEMMQMVLAAFPADKKPQPTEVFRYLTQEADAYECLPLLEVEFAIADAPFTAPDRFKKVILAKRGDYRATVVHDVGLTENSHYPTTEEEYPLLVVSGGSFTIYPILTGSVSLKAWCRLRCPEIISGKVIMDSEGTSLTCDDFRLANGNLTGAEIELYSIEDSKMAFSTRRKITAQSGTTCTISQSLEAGTYLFGVVCPADTDHVKIVDAVISRIKGGKPSESDKMENRIRGSVLARIRKDIAE